MLLCTKRTGSWDCGRLGGIARYSPIPFVLNPKLVLCSKRNKEYPLILHRLAKCHSSLTQMSCWTSFPSSQNFDRLNGQIWEIMLMSIIVLIWTKETQKLKYFHDNKKLFSSRITKRKVSFLTTVTTKHSTINVELACLEPEF